MTNHNADDSSISKYVADQLLQHKKKASLKSYTRTVQGYLRVDGKRFYTSCGRLTKGNFSFQPEPQDLQQLTYAKIMTRSDTTFCSPITTKERYISSMVTVELLKTGLKIVAVSWSLPDILDRDSGLIIILLLPDTELYGR